MYLLPSVLVLLSYVFGVYFAHQASRDVIDRPLLYNNRLILIALVILFAVIPFVAAIYLAIKDSDLIFVSLLVITRFLLLPALFSNKIDGFMDRRGF